MPGYPCCCKDCVSACTADIIIEEDPPCTFTLTGVATNCPGVAVVLWEWTFSDGSTGLGQVVQKTVEEGQFLGVTLKITDEDGCTNETALTLFCDIPITCENQGINFIFPERIAVSLQGFDGQDCDGQYVFCDQMTEVYEIAGVPIGPSFDDGISYSRFFDPGIPACPSGSGGSPPWTNIRTRFLCFSSQAINGTVTSGGGGGAWTFNFQLPVNNIIDFRQVFVLPYIGPVPSISSNYCNRTINGALIPPTSMTISPL